MITRPPRLPYPLTPILPAAFIGAAYALVSALPARPRHHLDHAAVAASLLAAGFFTARCHTYHHPRK